jgi:putative transposase
MGTGQSWRVDKRKRLRLSGFDYGSPGAYFVPACASRRGPVFGAVRGGTVHLNTHGLIVSQALGAIPDYHDVGVDTAIVMPDHVHAILIFDPTVEQTLSTVVGTLKARVTREVGQALWQRSFYDHVIRDEADLERVREYIETNPVRWSVRERDTEGPDRSGPYHRTRRTARAVRGPPHSRDGR